MKLIELKLKNFKGVKQFSFTPNGCNADIFGDNATGKTTLADALFWLLFDKDSQNRKGFEIKTLTPTGEAKHNLDHEVEATISLNGKQTTLRKVYKEKWTKKRGAASKEFTGHTTDHFIDGVPTSKSEYQRFISDICDEDTFRLLTDPRYFNEHIHWQKRRETLLEAFGDVSDQEVIESKKSLQALPELLGDRTMDDYRKIIHARRKEINSELERIPVRIDEATRNMPDTSGLRRATLEKNLQKIRDSIKEKMSELTRVREGGEVAEKQKQIRELETKVLEEYNKKYGEILKKKLEWEKELAEKQIRLSGITDKIASNEKNIIALELEVQDLESRIEAFRKEWHETNAMEWQGYNGPNVCPACGQPLPADQHQAAKEKAEAAFNETKAKTLAEISAQGKGLTAKLDLRKGDIASLRKDNLKLNVDRSNLTKIIEELTAKITAIGDAPPKETAMENPDIEALKNEIKLIQENSSEKAQKIKEEIDRLEAEKTDAEEKLAAIKAADAAKVRIADLEAQEKELVGEFEKMEHALHLCDEFVRAKVDLLEARINERFSIARFKLFDVQVNGGINECCEATVNGVPYSSLNNGARINVGLDIINTLSWIKGFAPMIFIDNKEAVTELFYPEKAQVIGLVVSPKHKKLKVIIHNENESQNNAEKAA